MTTQTIERATPRLPWGRWSIRGAALTYLAVFLVLPLIVVVVDGLGAGVESITSVVSSPIARHAIWLTIWTGLVMSLINAVMGLLTAFVLVRYEFPGKTLLNAVVDLPFAIPTLVTGVMLVILYGPQAAIGGWLNQQLGWQVIFAPSGIILALLFTSFPFVVRSVQPVLINLDRSSEEAAATLGAPAWQIFWRVTLPALLPALVSGTLLSFARAIGEFGAIVVVAGNIPLRSQTAAVYVYGEIESGSQRDASAMSLVMLAIALGTMSLVDWLSRRREVQA
ncbi:MAG: sulfate ABC transporter permease subunit CysT [Chloroflexi bacterium]|nr:sulfate ABC transporter permease subunit CysT [Chloroflexota bacterium]